MQDCANTCQLQTCHYISSPKAQLSACRDWEPKFKTAWKCRTRVASAPGAGSIEVADPALIAELVDVAGLYVSPCRGDALHDMGPWWMGQPRQVISEGRAELLRRETRK